MTAPAPALAARNFFTDNEDLQFHFRNAVDWARVVPALERGFTEEGGFANLQEAVSTYEETLTLVGRFCSEDVAPRAREVDRVAPRLEDGAVTLSPAMQANLAKARELGILGVDLPRAWGGWNFPATISGMIVEMLARACPATMAEYAFFAAPARLIVHFGDDALKHRFVPQLMSGELSGAICITESEAGSDVGNIRMTGERCDGGWRVNGRKQFITNGGADVAVVVVRTDPASKGLGGLSLFVVPKTVERDGVKIRNFTATRIEHKLCIRGSATCELEFDHSEAFLLGEAGRGFEEILAFMNEGRVGVALQSLGLSQAAYHTALAYAQGRVTMGKPIVKHELIADQFVDMDLEIRALRAMIYRGAAAEDRRRAAEAELASVAAGEPRRAELERELKQLNRLARELTPLVKYQGAEKCMEICKRALQIHGGYGVIEDYEVERYYRDSVIFTLYEGTSQIQALMALKDHMKWILTGFGGFVRRLGVAFVRRWLTVSPLGRRQARAEWELARSLSWLIARVMREQFRAARRAGKRGTALLAEMTKPAEHEGVAYARLSAERLARILYIVHAGRILVEQAAHGPERRRLAETWLVRRLPELRALAQAIRSGDRSALEFAERQAY